MIDLTKKALPDTVTVDGKAFSIKTDFRIWLQFERDYKESVRTKEPFNVDYIFTDEVPNGYVTEPLIAFARPISELPRPISGGSDAIALDYDIDAELIYSAFMEQYRIDLLTVDLHWHQFLALLKGISDNTMLAKVMGYRLYRKTDKKKDIREELRRAWEIIPPLSVDEQRELDEFNAFFEIEEKDEGQTESYYLKPERILPD